MNPIPLRHQRRVYAYACGRCHQVYDGGSIRSAILDVESERLSDKARGWWRWEDGEVFVPLDAWKASREVNP